jgi:hypothetical protein
MKKKGQFVFSWLAAALLGLASVGLASPLPAEKPAEPAPDANEVTPQPQVVGKIGDYLITKDEFKQRLAQEIRPQREEYVVSQELPTPLAVLRTMLAEKAMIMEARQRGYLDDEAMSSSIERYRQRLLVNLCANDFVMANVPVTEAEIAKERQTDPNLTREQAELKVRRVKAPPVIKAFYAQMQQKHKLEKVKENFSKAAEIHQRLLLHPAKPRGRTVFWITNKQIREELTDAEKNLVLARYSSGQFTLYDWFKALSSMAPPGRPKDLGQPQGVEKLLDRALPSVIWAAEAVARGYDKNEKLLQQVKAREDMQLLGKIKGEKYREVPEPNEAEMKAFFEAHQEQFATSATLKVEQVWCPDLQSAQEARKMLVQGASLEAVNKAHGLAEQSKPYNVYPSGEGIFWDELWKTEPNGVAGPLKGFYQTGIKWRVARVLEKTPPVPKPYGDDIKNQVKSAVMTQRRQKMFAAYETELLEKYPHEIYADKIKDIDPLEVTPVEEQPARATRRTR